MRRLAALPSLCFRWAGHCRRASMPCLPKQVHHLAAPVQRHASQRHFPPFTYFAVSTRSGQATTLSPRLQPGRSAGMDRRQQRMQLDQGVDWLDQGMVQPSAVRRGSGGVATLRPSRCGPRAGSKRQVERCVQDGSGGHSHLTFSCVSLMISVSFLQTVVFGRVGWQPTAPGDT